MGRSQVKGARSRQFWAFGSGYNSGAVIQKAPEGISLGYDFYRDTPLAGRVQPGGKTSFSKNFREEIKVFDSVANDFNVPIISTRIKAILEPLSGKDCEFIPIEILNHKGKVASKDHFLLHLLQVVDFIDMKRSKYKLGHIMPDQITWPKELHVLPNAVPPDVHIFRAKTLLTQVFIDDELYQAFQEQQITGLRLFPAEGWDGDTM